MGILDKFLQFFRENSIMQLPDKAFLDKERPFISEQEEKSFENSIYGQLKSKEADLPYIIQILPEAGDRLKKQIDLLSQLLEITNNENDDIRNSFEEFVKDYDENRRRADGEYTLKELEAENRRMDEAFENEVNPEKIDEYMSYISKIQEKINLAEKDGKPILTDVQKQRFYYASLKAEYRIKMLDLMCFINITPNVKNPFKNLSITKQKIFSKFFYEDLNASDKQYNMLSKSKNIFDKYMKITPFEELDNRTSRLMSQLAETTMNEDFSISQLFNSNKDAAESFQVLKEFIILKKIMNKMCKDKEEFEKCDEEEKKYRDMSDEDIKNEIDRIEHDLSIGGNKFFNILQFQRRVAKAKGFVDSENIIENNELMYKAIDPIKMKKIVEKANKEEINYKVFPDCEENAGGNFIIVMSRKDEDVLDVDIDKQTDFANLKQGFEVRKSFGTYPAIVLKLFRKDLSYLSVFNKLAAIPIEDGNYQLVYQIPKGSYLSNGDDVKYIVNAVETTLIGVKENFDNYGSSDELIKNVFPYIEVPITRNIMPILKKLKQEGITPYLEPVVTSNDKMGNHDMHIYFERKNLEKYKDKVEPEISKNRNGKIVLKMGKDASFGKSIKKCIDWSKCEEYYR